MNIYDLPFMMKENSREEQIRYYLQLLDSGFARTPEQKIRLRIKLWQIFNGYIRGGSSFIDYVFSFNSIRAFFRFLKYRIKDRKQFRSWQPQFKENLMELVKLFKPETDDDYLFQAEMYREIGNRREALQALRRIKEQKSVAYRKIKIATLLCRTQVIVLS